jgi:hypothetical protein
MLRFLLVGKRDDLVIVGLDAQGQILQFFKV